MLRKHREPTLRISFLVLRSCCRMVSSSGHMSSWMAAWGGTVTMRRAGMGAAASLDSCVDTPLSTMLCSSPAAERCCWPNPAAQDQAHVLERIQGHGNKRAGRTASQGKHLHAGR
jgi:hypothetical protein